MNIDFFCSNWCKIHIAGRGLLRLALSVVSATKTGNVLLELNPIRTKPDFGLMQQVRLRFMVSRVRVKDRSSGISF